MIQNNTLREETGGWFNVSIAHLDEISNCPEYVTHDNAAQVVVTPSENRVDFLHVGESIKITEKTLKTSSGTLHTINGEFEVAFQSKEIDTYFYECLYKKVILFGLKHDGQQKMYGSKKFPLNFNFEFINGTKYEDGATVRVTISGKIPQKPVFVNN